MYNVHVKCVLIKESILRKLYFLSVYLTCPYQNEYSEGIILLEIMFNLSLSKRIF